MFFPRLTGEEITQRRVYVSTGDWEVGDLWERRIVELCDGKTVGEIIQALYSQEVGKGSWMSDIGMWKTLFDREVVRTIDRLAEKGYLWVHTGPLDEKDAKRDKWKVERSH